MNQYQLNRAVARATGENVDRIARMGFTMTIVPERAPIRTSRSGGRRRGRHRRRACQTA